MKKVLFVLMSFAMLGMVSCNSCKHEKEPVFNGYNFESIAAEDYVNVVNAYDTTIRFYESAAWYKDTIDVVDGNYLVKIQNVFQYKDTNIKVIHFVDTAEIAKLIAYCDKMERWHEYKIDTNDVDYTFTIRVNDFWIEDQTMCLDSMNFTLDDALTIVRSLGTKMPASNFVVMRQPLFPPFPDHPYYIFGDVTNCVGVDSKTGKFVENF